MKLTPGVNFVSIFSYKSFFCAAFLHFVLFGWKNIVLKAAHKISVKLTTGVNFINIYARVFLYKFRRQSQKNVTRKAAKAKCSYKQIVHLTLMKLTAGFNFINILGVHFSYKILAPKITKLYFSFETFWRS
jgi:hypothetical protein